MTRLTISQKSDTLTKKQKKAMDYEEYSCKDDMDSHIEMMYDFNHLSKEEKKAMLNIKNQEFL